VLRCSRSPTTRALHHRVDPLHPLLLLLLSGALQSRVANCVSTSVPCTHISAAPRSCWTCPCCSTRAQTLFNRNSCAHSWDTCPKRFSAHAQRAAHCRSVCAFCHHGLAPCSATPPVSCHVAPQFGTASALLPNQPQLGAVSQQADRPPLFVLLPCLPSTPPPFRTTCQSSLCLSSKRQTTRPGAPP
jgi:hypothetical protein